jgi:NAD(P)-dependent dehydrogenase (short-subunit alcohol dehydrogenase family)
VGTESPVAEGSEDDWRWMLAVNLEGVRNGVKAFVPLLRERGQGGHIVNTASLSGLLPAAPLGVYTTSKFAVVGLSESLRQELAPHGIGVSTLLPPQVRTNLARSERNRPERFGGPSERENPLAAVLASGMDPDAVGEAVVAGVREGARFIFPDSTYLEPLRAQFQAFLDAMEKAPRVVESAG